MCVRGAVQNETQSNAFSVSSGFEFMMRGPGVQTAGA